MWLFLFAVAWAGSPPEVALKWKGDRGVLTVAGGVGEHVAREAPADLSLSWSGNVLRFELLGAQVEDGVVVPGLVPGALTGALRVSVCDDGGTTCRLVDLALEAEIPEIKRGRVSVQASAKAVSDVDAHSPYRIDAETTFNDASARAAAEGKLLLLDFTAVWCPPCNLMSAEVFDAPERSPVLERYQLAALDVDDPSSWNIKSRYAVTGYPTVIAARADGTEVSRFVGYPDASTFISWLEESSVGGGVSGDAVALGPEAVSPEQAAEIAWKLAQQGGGDLEPWLSRAAPAADHPALRRARVVHAPTVDDVRWLALHDTANPLEWLPGALSLQETDEGRSALLLAVRRGLAEAKGPRAADLLWVAGELSVTEDGPLLYAAAASVLRTTLTGDPVVDRGHISFLAELQERSGDIDGAIGLLAKYTGLFPDEPTFTLAASRLLHRAGRHQEALTQAELALAVAWGDNRLRATAAACEALVGLGRTSEAATLARRELDALPAPDAALAVRTHRYRAQLEAFAVR